MGEVALKGVIWQGSVRLYLNCNLKDGKKVGVGEHSR